MDGDLGSDTEGVEDRRAPWHSDVIKYSKTGTSDSMDSQTAIRTVSPFNICIKSAMFEEKKQYHLKSTKQCWLVHLCEVSYSLLHTNGLSLYLRRFTFKKTQHNTATDAI